VSEDGLRRLVARRRRVEMLALVLAAACAVVPMVAAARSGDLALYGAVVALALAGAYVYGYALTWRLAELLRPLFGVQTRLNRYAYWVPCPGGADVHLRQRAVRDGAGQPIAVGRALFKGLAQLAAGPLPPGLPPRARVSVQSHLCDPILMARHLPQFTFRPAAPGPEAKIAAQGVHRLRKVARWLGRDLPVTAQHRENIAVVWSAPIGGERSPTSPAATARDPRPPVCTAPP
jgi:hypothetical protein